MADNRYSSGVRPSSLTRPRPQVPGSPSARADVLKDLKKKDRRRYSTMKDAASIAALDRAL